MFFFFYYHFISRFHQYLDYNIRRSLFLTYSNISYVSSKWKAVFYLDRALQIVLSLVIFVIFEDFTLNLIYYFNNRSHRRYNFFFTAFRSSVPLCDVNGDSDASSVCGWKLHIYCYCCSCCYAYLLLSKRIKINSKINYCHCRCCCCKLLV